jgi:hypothetical protein
MQCDRAGDQGQLEIALPVGTVEQDIERIVGGRPEDIEAVEICSAVDRVRPVADHVCDRIVTGTAAHRIVARASGEGVVAVAAAEGVGAACACDEVVAAETLDVVRPAAAGEHVLLAGADDRRRVR